VSYFYQAMNINYEGNGLVQSEGFKIDSGDVTPLLAHISWVHIHALLEDL